jgi:hypothetical protein
VDPVFWTVLVGDPDRPAFRAVRSTEERARTLAARLVARGIEEVWIEPPGGRGAPRYQYELGRGR